MATIRSLFGLLSLLFLSTLIPTAESAGCTLASDTVVLLYADPANDADPLWFQSVLTWWASANPTLKFQSFTAAQIKVCTLANFPNLRIFIHPGGDSYNSLSALGATGVAIVKNFINRNQVNPSAYVSACAGSYAGAYSYIWENLYEAPGYFNYATNPPYAFFPHAVEGSIVDISDAQFGSYESNGATFYRKVNVSNGHKMIYWGGPTQGYNGVIPAVDSRLTPLLYFSDFYGYQTNAMAQSSPNMMAAWLYQTAGSTRPNTYFSSVHVEADQTVCGTGCLPAGTLTANEITQNYAWLVTQMNLVATTTFAIPSVPVQPSFNTAAPHTAYPTMPCYSASANVLFCDDFTTAAGTVYPGMYQWQRNNTAYNKAYPWNVTFTPTLMNQVNYFGAGQDGTADGFAITIPNTATGNPPATISSKSFSTVGRSAVTLEFYYKGKTLIGGYFNVKYSTNGGNTWTTLRGAPINPAVTAWTLDAYALPVGQADVRVRFECSAGGAVTNYCGVDSVVVHY